MTGEYHRDSDFDFMVDFLPEARHRFDGHPRHYLFGKSNGSPYPANYRALTSALEELLTENPDRPGHRPLVDIGTYNCIDNPYFKEAVDSQKIALYVRP